MLSNYMTKLYRTLATLMLVSLTLFSTSAQALSQDEARKAVEPLYHFLSNPADPAAVEQVRHAFAADWISFYSNQGSKNLEQTIGAIGYFGKLIPDLNWQIMDLQIAGDVVIVRGEATGTPAGEFFGVPHSGKSFRIMSIDMHTVKDGKVTRSYHIEDWAGAIRQLSGK